MKFQPPFFVILVRLSVGLGQLNGRFFGSSTLFTLLSVTAFFGVMAFTSVVIVFVISLTQLDNPSIWVCTSGWIAGIGGL